MRRSGMTPELMAYHGTPHTFAPEPGAPMGRFRAEKIGSGEGVQAYGHGLYFAESPEVAGSYRTTLSSRTKDRLKVDGKVVDPDTLFGRAVEDIPRIGLQATLQKIDDNIRFNSKYAPNIADLYKSVRQQVENLDPSSVTLDKGSLYTVDIPDEMVDKMLDWNKPLTQQPKGVQQKLQTLVDSQFGKGTWSSWSQNDPDYKDLANDLFSGKSAAEVSELLRQSGIPGIKYLDEQSRSSFKVQNTYKGEPYGDPVSFKTEEQAKQYAEEQIKKGFGADLQPGTRNIVVFPGEEQNVKILSRE